MLLINVRSERIYRAMAAPHGFVFVVDEGLCEGALIGLVVTTPAGATVELWSEVELTGRTVVLRQFAIFGVDVSARELGAGVLRAMARAAMEEFDVDRIRIEEARRTSGAVPGRTIPVIEFRRRADEARSRASAREEG